MQILCMKNNQEDVGTHGKHPKEKLSHFAAASACILPSVLKGFCTGIMIEPQINPVQLLLTVNIIPAGLEAMD